MCAATLGKFVFVVREHEVLAAAVNIDRLAQVLRGHGRALDMPPGPAPAPRRIPAGQFGGRRLPQDEVMCRLLVRCDLDSRTRDHLTKISPRKGAIVGIVLDIEQYMPIGLIRMAGINQLLDHRNHLVDVLRCSRFDVGRLHAERTHVVVVCLDELRGDLFDRLAGFDRSCVDLVVDVRDIAGKSQLVASPEQTREQVEHDGRARVADMRIVVDRRSTQIHRNLAIAERLKRDLFAPPGIVQTYCHYPAHCCRQGRA